MSNNDLRCPKCKAQHHPAYCPLDNTLIEGIVDELFSLHYYLHDNIPAKEFNKELRKKATKIAEKLTLNTDKLLKLSSEYGQRSTFLVALKQQASKLITLQ